MYSNSLLVISGPTAIGKTDISINVAKLLDTEIISADSRQCYIELNIGTAKPSLEQLSTIMHYFINEFSITTSLSAADFEKFSLKHLDTIFSTHKTAIVCGGTGLYIKALCDGLDLMPETKPEIVQEIENEYKEKGIGWLQKAIFNEDPEFYKIGEIQNPLRMVRALSFLRTNGKSIINYRTNIKKQRPFNIIKIGLELERQVLYARINERVDIMMRNGLLEEVEKLYPQKHLKNLQTVGYVELFNYLDGIFSLPEAIEKIKQNTRNYAKRQLTWFKKDKKINWLWADDKYVVEKIIDLQSCFKG